jgi:hypothetical protein
MERETGNAYFHKEPFSKMEEFSIIGALRKFCRVLDKGIWPEPKGITIITEKPLDEEVQKSLGLVPVEDL